MSRAKSVRWPLGRMGELLSVVFPVGPGVPRAGRALDDLLAQTYSDLEIISVLNGCPEEVREDFLGRRESRLRVLDLGSEGRLLDALEWAVNESRGSWLGRMDSDDRCAPERFERQVSMLEDGEVEVVSCGISLCGALGDGMQRYVDWVNRLDTPEKVARERFVESPVVQPTVVMAKSLFQKAGGYLRNGHAEDYDLWLRLLGRGVRFGKVPELLYHWYDRKERLTRSDPRFGQKRMLALKARALSELSRVQEQGVVLAGAGPIGRVLGRELKRNGIGLHGYFEVNPKRIGRECQGAPIAGPNGLGKRWRKAVLLGAVGVGDGRDRVRALAAGTGYQEGLDFWSCC